MDCIFPIDFSEMKSNETQNGLEKNVKSPSNNEFLSDFLNSEHQYFFSFYYAIFNYLYTNHFQIETQMIA